MSVELNKRINRSLAIEVAILFVIALVVVFVARSVFS